MRFAFDDQQIEFRDVVRQLLANECTTDHLRAAFNRPAARTPRWDVLTRLGVVGLTAPASAGGLGLGLLDLVLLLEEAGRVSLPEPLLETTAVAAPLLVDLVELHRRDDRSGAWRDAGAGPEQWLEGIAGGGVAAAVGPTPAGAAVAGADGCDLLVAWTVGGAEGPEIHLVAGKEASTTPVSSLDPTRRLGVPTWVPTPETLAASGSEAESAIARACDRAAVATAANLVGLADRMIGMAAEYAKERHQFSRAIGSFQAVKHLLAGARVTLEFARPVVYAAAWSIDEGMPDASRAASVAKAYASDAAAEAARVSLQVHGAIGYTWECDLHLFLKRAWALCEAWGSAGEHRQRVLASLLNGR